MRGRAVKWAVRVVLEVGRRSGGLLPDDSGTDEAALAAQGVEAAHGVGVSNLGGLTEELVQVLVGVGVAATGHLEGDGMDLYAVPGLVVVDLGLHGLGEEFVRDHSTSIVREIPGDVDAGSSQAAGTGCEDVEVLRGIALRIQDARCRVLGGCYRVVESRPLLRKGDVAAAIGVRVVISQGLVVHAGCEYTRQPDFAV